MFSHAEVWHKSFEVVSTQELKVLAILNGGGGCQTFPPLKGGA